MMGAKIRNFAPLPELSLEELVPEDNFYRRLEERLDLSFARDLVKDRYAAAGRPSVDPVVFLQASAGALLREPEERATADGGRGGPSLAALVPRL